MTQPSQPSSSAGFQQAQSGLLIALEAEVAQAYVADLNVDKLKSTLPILKRTLLALTRHYGLASQALSLNFYRDQRKAARVVGPVRLPAPSYPDVPKLNKGVNWATRVLWTRNSPDVATGLTNVQGVVEKSVLDLGRNSILDSVHADKKALGWARVTEPKPCSFCALLATRGAVYRSETTADFAAHDHCRCHAEPVFTAYEPTAKIREYQALYKQFPGLNNFRRAYESKYGM